MNFTYDANGNLTQKTVMLSTSEQFDSATYRTIKYNSNNKPIAITNQNGTTTTFDYGSDGLRYKQITPDKTTHYVAGGSFEVEIEGSKETTRAYIGDYAIMTRSSDGTFGMKYLHRDRLGSVDTITDAYTLAEMSIVGIMPIEQRTYNAFGKARTASGARAEGGTEGRGLFSTDITPRGFTNHEHLGDSGIIHMNGRAYDPELGRFLSVDPFITFPEDGQSLNPYSYVMNNPLKYTDPSGYTAKPRLTLKERNKIKESGATAVLVSESTNADGSVTRELFAVKLKSNGAGSGSNPQSGDKGNADAGTPTAPKTTRNKDMHPDSGNDNSLVNNYETPELDAAFADDGSEDSGPTALLAGKGGAGRRASNAHGNYYIYVRAQSLIRQIRSIDSSFSVARPRGHRFGRRDIRNLEQTLAGLRKSVKLYWPTNMGFMGESLGAYLRPGQRVDRYGAPDGGYFLSPAGTPFPQRALPAHSLRAPYTIYEVMKPIHVRAGTIAPAFNQIGGGTQYITPVSIGTLLRKGFLKVVK
ncbi:MAG: glycohydrolase toxin TNT-related protein [Algicola sp.]|nr:glycohydrolase toxin TNT-related protein [Algicola sp.]